MMSAVNFWGPFFGGFGLLLAQFHCTSFIKMFHSPTRRSSFSSGVDKQDSAVEMVVDRIRVKSICVWVLALS